MREHSMNRLLFASLFLLFPGCSLVVDGTLAGRDAGSGVDAPLEDTGPAPTACTGRPDGTFCDIEGLTDREICLGGVCVVSVCGDGFADTRMGHPSGIPPVEACDDANPVDGDGCEADCTFSCDDDTDCPDDTLLCNGVPTCDTTMHVCTSMPLADLTPCEIPGPPVVPGFCRSGMCRAGVCPDGTVDAGEDCDDDNTTDGDGCDADCTFSCVDDSTCQNSTACDGSEVCDLASHTCTGGAPPVCDDGDPCTADACDPALGCVAPSVLADADMDGYFGVTASCGGDDCADTNPAINPGVVEGCGTTMDMNCDGRVEAMPTWYADCDRDGYARSGAQTTLSCTMPTGGPSGCSSGTWISRAPTSGATDCVDTNSSARPGQSLWFSTPASGSSYDYNCNGSTEREFPTNPTFIITCSFDSRGTCGGSTYWSETSTPACGSMATQSYCAVRGFPLETCYRTTAERVVRCH